MADPNFELRFFEDRLKSGGGKLGPAVRVLYVLEGAVSVNGGALGASEGLLVENAVEIAADGGPARLARWELAPAGSPLATLGKSSNKRTDFVQLDPGAWGIRLDTVTFPPGTRAYKHIHASFGIRYLLKGTLEINTDRGRYLNEPGMAWFEGVDEPVLAIASTETESMFVRMMVLPPAYHGKLTITYVDPADDGKPREQINNRLLDEMVEIS